MKNISNNLVFADSRDIDESMCIACNETDIIIAHMDNEAKLTSDEEIIRVGRIMATAPQLLDAVESCQRNYGKLHDALSDCIESGRLTESQLPDDYKALVHYLLACNASDLACVTALAKAKGGAK